jgi:chloramphenicol O-acetyltransferase type B
MGNLMSLWNRIAWLVYGRKSLAKNNSWAHWFTHVEGRLVLHGYNRLYRGSFVADSELGKFTYVAGAKIVNSRIGAFCSIGPGAVIGGLGKHPTRWLTTHPAFYSTRMQSGITFAKENLYGEVQETILGNDVWIGARATILNGITIGDGAIVAAGAVVAKNVEPYAIVGGVPAKLIRYRFDNEVIACLLDWKWWDLPIEILAEIAGDFTVTEDWPLAGIESIRLRADLLHRNALTNFKNNG